MSWRVCIVAAVVSCGGKAIEAGDSGMHSPPALMGSCTGSQTAGWSCTNASVADAAVAVGSDAASSDGAAGGASGGGVSAASRPLPSCGPNVGTGSCVATQNTIDTTNSTTPVHIENSECLACANGVGTDWMCLSQTWQVVGTLSCSP